VLTQQWAVHTNAQAVHAVRASAGFCQSDCAVPDCCRVLCTGGDYYLVANDFPSYLDSQVSLALLPP
jgi:hypothetical protein